MEPNCSTYKENNVGARIDPCGTPQERCAVEEACFPIQIENILLVKKKTGTNSKWYPECLMPKRFSSQEIRIE